MAPVSADGVSAVGVEEVQPFRVDQEAGSLAYLHRSARLGARDTGARRHHRVRAGRLGRPDPSALLVDAAGVDGEVDEQLRSEGLDQLHFAGDDTEAVPGIGSRT